MNRKTWWEVCPINEIEWGRDPTPGCVDLNIDID